jgi:hypothetical protein
MGLSKGPFGSRPTKDHYFKGAKSLCGKVVFMGETKGDLRDEPANETCSECTKRHRSRMKERR